jgi:hypothetical protein
MCSLIVLFYTTNMGIRGLQNWIRWTVPQTVVSPDWAKLSNTRVGIDILGFLYRAKSRGIYPIVYVAHLVAMCKRLDIEPVILFDGKPPTEKQHTLVQRTALRVESNVKKTVCLTPQERQKLELNSTYFTSEERDQVKQFLYSCGVLSLNASGEADNTLAYLNRKGWISAVISSDFDFLPRGVETLIVPAHEGLPHESSGWKQYSLSNILRLADMTRNQFVEMCVLMGSDYTANLPSIPYKTAYWTVKHACSTEYTLARFNIRDTEPYRRAKQILTGVLDTEASLMNDKQWEKWHAGSPRIELEALTEFVHLYFPTSDVNDIVSSLSNQPPNPSNPDNPSNILLPDNGLFNDLTQYTRSMSNYTSSPAA